MPRVWPSPSSSIPPARVRVSLLSCRIRTKQELRVKRTPQKPRNSYISGMPTRIAIDCLNCGHTTSVAEERLPDFGLEQKASLVTLSKRLVCKECGSKAVRTFRYVE